MPGDDVSSHDVEHEKRGGNGNDHRKHEEADDVPWNHFSEWRLPSPNHRLLVLFDPNSRLLLCLCHLLPG